MLKRSFILALCCAAIALISSGAAHAERILKDLQTGCKIKTGWTDPTHIKWSGSCKNGFVDGPGILTWYKSGKIIWEGHYGLGSAFKLTSGGEYWNFEDSDVPMELSLCDLGQDLGFGVKSSYRSRTVTVKLRRALEVYDNRVVMRILKLAANFANSKCPIGGYKNIKVLIQTKDCIIKEWTYSCGVMASNRSKDSLEWETLNNYAARDQRKRIEQMNHDAEQMARQDAARAKQERIARQIADADRRWKAHIEAVFGDSRAVGNIADLVVYDRARFIDEFSTGRKITVHYIDPNYSDGKYVLNFRTVQTDIYRSVEKDNSFSWAKWLDMTQNPHQPSYYDVACIISRSDAGTMQSGNRYVLNARLDRFLGKSIVLKCTR